MTPDTICALLFILLVVAFFFMDGDDFPNDGYRPRLQVALAK